MGKGFLFIDVKSESLQQQAWLWLLEVCKEAETQAGLSVQRKS